MTIYSIQQREKMFASELLRETWYFPIVSLFLTLVICIAEYGTAIVSIIEKEQNTPSGLYGQLLSSPVRAALQHVDQVPYMDKMSVALFWAITAVGVYSIYSFVGSMLAATQAQVRMDRLSNIAVMRTIVTHFSEKIIALIVFFVVIILGWNVLAVYWMQLINLYVLSVLSPNYIGACITGVIGLWATIYILLLTAYITWFYERSTLD